MTRPDVTTPPKRLHILGNEEIEALCRMQRFGVYAKTPLLAHRAERLSALPSPVCICFPT